MTKISLLEDSCIDNLQGPNHSVHIIFLVIVLFLFIAFFWAKFAILDEVTVGNGKVIPSQEMQIIQNLEGGIISEILVHEGQVVEKGQVLMKIDDTRFSASYKEVQQKILNLELDIARLSAEIENKPFEVEESLISKNEALYQYKKLLYKTKIEEKKELKKALVLAQKELNLMKPLVDKGALSEVEIIRVERTENELKRKLLAYNSDALKELNQAKSELNSLNESHLADKDRLTRTTVRAPLKGIINQIKINTIGGVVKPGMDLLEIVPLDDTLLIEARIRPSDIGFIHPKQKAVVKLTAYDFSIYGGLTGIVEHISADTILDENDESFYLIRIRTQKNFLGTEKSPLYIIPGMLATVDILTGKKSVLDYLLKPILKARSNALRER